MQKIMFDDKYELTKAVLEGRKTQTRRLIKCPIEFKGEYVAGFNVHIRQSDKKVVGLPCLYDADEREFDGGEILPRYKVDEVVAVAQRYSEAINPLDWAQTSICKETAGWNNKLFVRADLMPHHIQITDIRIERLQDISDEDCLAEGIKKIEPNRISNAFGLNNSYEIPGQFPIFETPREAYAALIDKVSGEGTWDSNPWVFVYDFKLIK